MSKQPTDKELVEIGKKMMYLYQTGFISYKQSLKYTFIRGVVYGFGLFLGGTIVVAIVLWILSLFDQVPFINHIINALQSAQKSNL